MGHPSQVGDEWVHVQKVEEVGILIYLDRVGEALQIISNLQSE